MRFAMLAVAAALAVAASSGCTLLRNCNHGCSAGCSGGCNQCGLASAYEGGVDHFGNCHCEECTGGGGGGGLAGILGSRGKRVRPIGDEYPLPGVGAGPFPGGTRKLGREFKHTRRVMGPPGPPSAQVTYPYYTTRGPRDFLNPNPWSIGP